MKRVFKRLVSRVVGGAPYTDPMPRLEGRLAALRAELGAARMLAARTLVEQLRGREFERISDAGFKVFSQFDDDGIIQYLVRRLGIEPRTFIEFGVEDYAEANTRFLLLNDDWAGLVLDSDADNIAAIKRDPEFWQHELTAEQAFITRENIDGLLTGAGFQGPVGILSVDVDGNDYWIWEALTAVEPVLVVVEYNSVFGPERAVTVPYDPGFYRTAAHHSNLYFGASLKALCLLAARKGFAFVGSNRAGNNAYFVRESHLGGLRPLTAEEGYVRSRFRESRDAEGNLTYLAGDERLRAIEEMQVFDVEAGALVPVKDLTAARG